MTTESSTTIGHQEFPKVKIHRAEMGGKPVYEIEIKTIINFASAFDEKLLCDGLTFSLGSACVFRCPFCYVEPVVARHPAVRALLRKIEHQGLTFQDIVIRRRSALDLMFEELTTKRPRRIDPKRPAVIFSSPLVDPAPNLKLADETLEACLLICRLTNWTIRILSKGNLLPRIAKSIPDEFRNRFIFGFSTGTVSDKVAMFLEAGTALVSKRLEALHWLQDNGFRTYAMICPSLPQADPDSFVQQALEAVRADQCEAAWAEVMNVRGDSLKKSCLALEKGGLHDEVSRLRAVAGAGKSGAWDQYARETFLAYTRHLGPDKLRFLQYPSRRSASWWLERRHQGALLLGAHAQRLD